MRFIFMKFLSRTKSPELDILKIERIAVNEF